MQRQFLLLTNCICICILSGISFKADIIEICTKKYLYQTLEDTLDDRCITNDVQSAGRDPLLLPVGSRVRRGRDWQWGDQDNFGAGTVVRHPKSGWLVVKWDNGFTTNYRYGSSHGIPNMNKYDVEVCEEPRALNNELIAVGCVVKRGTLIDKLHRVGIGIISFC